MSLTCGGPGWRVVARFKLTCYHVLLTRSTTGCTHLRSGVGAENRESGRGEGDKGHGVTAAWHIHNTQTGLHNAPPYTSHFPHRTQPLHMQSRTGDSLHRAQGEGRGEGRLGRATAHTDTNNTMALTCGSPGWRVVARPLQADLLPRALHTIHCWMHTRLESAGRRRGEQREGGGGETVSATRLKHTHEHGRPQRSIPQPPLPTPHTTHAVTHR
jgi:hypothetical protein